MYVLTLVAPALGAPEIPNDGVDQDGDGGDAIRQDFRATFAGAGPAAAQGWLAAGGATFPGDIADIGGGKVARSGASPSLFMNGDLYVAADVDALTGMCTGTVKWHTIAGPGPVITTNFALSAGTSSYAITTTQMIAVDGIELACNPGASAEVDWIVLQNGTAAFAPVGDVDITWEDVHKPFGGYHNAVTVRGYAAEDAVWADGLVATLDVGGVAFYDEAAGKWEVRDGEWPNMLHQPGERAMGDACRTHDGEVLAISGAIDTSYVCNASDPDACSTMVDGRLMATSDDGGAWLPEADSYQTPGGALPRSR